MKLSDLLQIPWLGLRPDLILYPGPTDPDGQKSWVIEDPVRGNHFRLGHAEGEILYRLNISKTPDEALQHLYTTTTLRPTIAEVARFIQMLQQEKLAILPEEAAIGSDATGTPTTPPTYWQQIKHGNIFFRIPLLKPDAFLTRSLPWVSLFWSPFFRWIYLICGVAGLALTAQEIDIYLNTINYLFTPQGSLIFFLSLTALKIGHEFAHAYTAKSLGLHVRTMGVMLIVVWPLLYTDTTDAWKIPDRRSRMKISAAGVLFEMTLAGVALLLWALSPEGIFRSLTFFLSGTSLLSTLLINLNPFMRYDGYYLLMDLWQIDNLRPRSSALFRHFMRRLLLDWQGQIPETHPHQTGMIIYGFCALIYRLFIGLSIAISVYYLFFPMLGLLVLLVEIWLFILFPLVIECRAIIRQRQLLGSKFRLALSAIVMATLTALLVLPLPRMERIPCMVIRQDTHRLEAPAESRLNSELPTEGADIKKDAPLLRLSSDQLEHELTQVRFDLANVRTSMRALSSGGEQGGYRKWLIAEEARLKAAEAKYNEAVAQLEIRAPITGRIVDVNPDLYKGAFLAKGAYILTVATANQYEVKAFVHEKQVKQLSEIKTDHSRIRFAGIGIPSLPVTLDSKNLFPVNHFPNDSLFDVAGGPITTVVDTVGRRPRDAYFAFTFKIDRQGFSIAHGMPSWLWITTEGDSLIYTLVSNIWNRLFERGLF